MDSETRPQGENLHPVADWRKLDDGFSLGDERLSRSELDLPYAWQPFGWPRSFEAERITSLLRFWPRLRSQLIEREEMRFFFAFVAVVEDLPLEEAPPREGHERHDPNAAALRRLHTREGRPPPTRQIVLDMIDAGHFQACADAIPTCPINDRAAAGRRRGMLAETDLLNSEMLATAMLLLAGESDIEAGYIANLLPSTWHRVVIGRQAGLPLLLTQDYEEEAVPAHRLLYAAPATFAEAASLTEIISLNHIPDAGA